MADTTASILVQLIDEASAGFKKIQKAGEDMARELSGNLSGLESTGEAIKGFTDPLVEGLGRSKKAAIGFESEMAEVAKVSGFSAKQIEEVGKITKGLSREIPMTTSGLNDIATAAGQSGIALKDTKGFITDVAKAATAFYGGSSAKELERGAKDAALAFGKITNIFDIPINKVSTLAAAINVLGDSSIASERDIINAMTRTSALGKQAQLTAKEMAALNASMISLGMAPSVAATATNALLSRLTTAEIQSARFQKGLDMIGISAANMQQLVQSGGNNAIFALSDALDKLDPVKRAQAIGQMFGAEHSDNVGIFLDRIELYKQLLGSVSNDQQNLNRYNQVFEAQVNTTASQIQILNNAYQELAIEIGTALLPAIKAFVKFLTPIIQGIAAFAKKHPNIVRIGAALVGVAAAAGSAMLAMAALGRTWEGIQAGIPILAKLSDRFLGVGNPVSKFLNKMAGANQRLKDTGKLTDKIAMPDFQMGKDCLPICVCPELCEDWAAKIKAQIAELDCLPICVYPEFHDLKTALVGKMASENAKKIPAPAPITEIAEPASTAEIAKEIEQPIKEAQQARKIGIPQIFALIVAIASATNAIKKLTDSNANLASKALSVVGAITAANTAREMLKPKEAAAEITQQTPAITPTETPAVTEAQRLSAIFIVGAQQLGATQLANAQQLTATLLTNAQQLGAIQLANVQQLTTTFLANAQQLSATLLASIQQLSANFLTNAQQFGTTLLASAQQTGAILSTSAQELGANLLASIQGFGETLNAGAQQLGQTLQFGAQETGSIFVVSGQEAGSFLIAGAQQAGSILAGIIQEASAMLSEASAMIASNAQELSEVKAAQRSSGGGLKNAALLGLGAVGIGGAAFLGSKAIGAVGGIFGGIKSAIGGAAGAIGGAASKAAGAIGGVAAGASKAAGAIGGAATGAASAIGGAAQGAASAIGGLASKAGPIGQAIVGAGKSAAGAIGGAGAAAGGALKGAVGAAGGAATSAGKTAAGAVGGLLGKVAGGTGAIGGTIVKGATGALGSALAPLKSGVVGLGSIASGAKGAIGGAISAAKAAAPLASAAAPIVTAAAGAAATPSSAPKEINSISRFTRQSTPAADLAQQSASIQRNNIVPLSRSSSDSGKAVAGGLASGINSGKGEASKAAAGLAQSVSDYLPRSPAKVGPLADLNKTGSGLISEFTKGIDGGAVASKMESALKPPSMFGNLPFEGKQETAQNTITYAPNYSLNGVDRDNFIAELEKHDRQFMDWLNRTQDRFSRGRY